MVLLSLAVAADNQQEGEIQWNTRSVGPARTEDRAQIAGRVMIRTTKDRSAEVVETEDLEQTEENPSRGDEADRHHL
jgi:hypothetical protein